jgi:hypothetical protein
MTTKRQANVFLTTVLRPTLRHIALSSEAAEQLLLGTALAESRLVHRKQMGGGPARGLFQMEPATHDDIWSNFLEYRPTLAQKIRSLLSSPKANAHLELEKNDKYACAMARAHYMRAPNPLPKCGDTKAMATYWRQYYNTPLGAGTVSKYVATWQKVMGEK